MKKLSILLIVLTLISCGKEVKEIKGLTGELLEQYEVSETSNGSILRNGFYKSWYPSGQIKINCNYNENKLDGEYLSYYSNGNKKLEGNYINDKEEGKWTMFFSNGQLEQIAYYKNGLTEGEFIGYYENGQKRAEGLYSNNKEEGLFKYWDNNGKLTQEKKYKNGEIVTFIGKWDIGHETTLLFNEDGSLVIHKSDETKTASYQINGEMIRIDQVVYKITSTFENSFELNKYNGYGVSQSEGDNIIKGIRIK